MPRKYIALTLYWVAIAAAWGNLAMIVATYWDSLIGSMAGAAFFLVIVLSFPIWVVAHNLYAARKLTSTYWAGNALVLVLMFVVPVFFSV
jgi:hypothetical protein